MLDDVHDLRRVLAMVLLDLFFRARRDRATSFGHRRGVDRIEV